MTTTTALHNLLSAQGRSPRQGQIDACEAIDGGDQHVALQAPTGVGKSALAIAASIAHGGGIVAMHSNGLIGQYAEEFDSWRAATGKKITSLVGKAHYWCKVASPDLVGLTPAQQVHVRRTGSFLGAGIEQRDYIAHSVLAVEPVTDEEEGNDRPQSPCKSCLSKDECPLWVARNEAQTADIVVTNATMLGLALGGSVEWAAAAIKPVIILDEAHADVEPIAAVLGNQITLRDERALSGLEEALNVVREIAAGDEEEKATKGARRFLAAARNAKEEGRSVVFSAEETKVVLTVPADLRKAFAPHKVIALSATLSQRNVDALGLDAEVVNLQGLDVSASTVFVDGTAPEWAWGKGNPAQHKQWAQYSADRITKAFREGGATLALFVSKDDLHATVALLPKDVQRAVIHYYSGVDRDAAIAAYKENPKGHVLVGCVSGAGTGVNLPGDLLRTVILTRVPQNAPKGTDRAVWLEDTRAAVVQSVGRAHRFDGDWGHVHVLGGFGHRKDVQRSLTDLGWVIK
jgi:Rad3-related DNA helicase